MKNRDIELLDFLFTHSTNVNSFANARITAAVVYKGRIISIGFNQNKTDPFQKRFSKNKHSLYLHAEVHAIKKARKILCKDEMSKASLYIARSVKHIENPNTKKAKVFYSHGLAKPCEGCQKCIDYYGIRKVYYTINNCNQDKIAA